MPQFDQNIRETRTIEATRKGYMGVSGRIGTIARQLGQPIISQSEGSEFYSESSFDNSNWAPRQTGDAAEKMPCIWDLNDGQEPNEPTGGDWSDDRDSIQPVNIQNDGWHFDGLSRSIHMEILCRDDEIRLYWQGRVVYSEVGGELLVFVPNEEWETPVRNLGIIALQKEQSQGISERARNKRENEAKKFGWIREMRSRWGI